MPRKHRRVHHPRTNCRCPEGAKKVPTQKGRSFGCLAMVMAPGSRKPLPRFVKMLCDKEAGEVKQWRPPPGYKRKSTRKRPEGSRVFPEQFRIPFRRSDEDLPLLRTLKTLTEKQREALRPFLSPEQQEQLPLFNNNKQLPLFNNRKTPVPDDDPDKTPSWWRQ